MTDLEAGLIQMARLDRVWTQILRQMYIENAKKIFAVAQLGVATAKISCYNGFILMKRGC